MAIKFVAYIDESGDTGLENVKPTNSASGATEWLVLSCFLVKIENDHNCVNWVKEIKSKFKNSNSPFLHYKELIPAKRTIACQLINEKPCRFFIVASNKKNIEGFKNAAAAFVGGNGTSWLYWWLSRLLLERVTKMCESAVPTEDRGKSKIQFIFSRRGGLRYVDFRDYLRRLHKQSRLGSLYLDQGDLCWSVVDDEELLVLDSKERAGLQLSDLCAGAFFQALELKTNFDVQYAKLFKSRMAQHPDTRSVAGFGIKTMPHHRKMDLSNEQREILKYYGYKF